MDPDQVISDLFFKLREILFEEYGTRLALTAAAQDIALSIRASTGSDETIPAFALTVSPRNGAFRVAYRPRGKKAPAPEKRMVRYDEPDVERMLFGVVMGYVESERKRLIEYRRNF